jgi:predicted outer membrane repeat protein
MGSSAALKSAMDPSCLQGPVIVGSGSRVSNNTAAQDGGVLAAASLLSSFVVSGSTLIGNAAVAGNGGAVAVESIMGDLTVSQGGSVTNNSAGGSGGVLHAKEFMGAVVVSGSSVATDNKASGDGEMCRIGRRGHVHPTTPARTSHRRRSRPALLGLQHVATHCLAAPASLQVA